MRHLGSLRVYEPVIRELCARGHEVHLALGRAEALGWKTALDNLLAAHPGMTCSWDSASPAAFWAELGKTIRLWADYLRYFDDQYGPFPKLKARAAEKVPPRLLAIAHRPVFQHARNRGRLLRLLRALERALPAVPEVERELRERRPDLVLVTPLVYLGSSQFEVLRTAVAMGLRTIFCVGSWDHLSSKALIRDMPQRVLVWNETQKNEAVQLHGVPPDRVIVTGAQCYDEWFGRVPSRTREQFCRQVGLPVDRPFILYVCSALFWGSPVEAEFVLRWVRSLRASAHAQVRGAAVLIRPHPARLEEWKSIDLSAFPDVALYGSNPVDTSSKHDYFESLYYSSAIVGLNTSAFLEGAIVGRPIHTVLLPEFHDNQEGVLHFHYLFDVGGGVLQAARSFEEHHDQLTESLGGRRSFVEDSAAGAVSSTNDLRPHFSFVREFVRPHGLDRPATPLFCDAVETVLRMPPPEPEPTPVRFVVLRWAMSPVFRMVRAVFGAELIRDDWSRKARDRRQLKEARLREREDRRRQKAELHQRRQDERAAEVAARAAAERARLDARAREEAQKAEVKRSKARAKAARERSRRRAAMRAQLKSRAVRLLGGWRSDGQGHAR
jgi:hypothetical protein